LSLLVVEEEQVAAAVEEREACWLGLLTRLSELILLPLVLVVLVEETTQQKTMHLLQTVITLYLEV